MSLGAVSTYAGEGSEVKCMINYDGTKNMMTLTNVIDPTSEAIVEENCFDLAKRATKATVGGQSVAGVEVIYKN